jgi:hypothetical protein
METCRADAVTAPAPGYVRGAQRLATSVQVGAVGSGSRAPARSPSNITARYRRRSSLVRSGHAADGAQFGYRRACAFA